MSRTIWTQCAGSSEIGPVEATPWRVVEYQYKNSTRQLVESLEQQGTLEELIDEVKPRSPDEPGFERLHYLLTTPFRYPPLRYGSRFGTINERGIWYGSDELDTSLAEVAFYRFQLADGADTILRPLVMHLSAFRVPVASEHGLDLSVGPFARYRARIAAKDSYVETQALGASMRAAGVEVFRYPSARAHGTNVGLFAPAFVARKPKALDAWSCRIEGRVAEVIPLGASGFPRVFRREEFEVDGVLPAPGFEPPANRPPPTAPPRNPGKPAKARNRSPKSP